MSVVARALGSGRIARRITLVGGAFLFVVIGLITVLMTSMLLSGARERSTAWMDAKVETVALALDAHDSTSKLMVERFFKVFSDQFGRAFALSEETGKLSQLGIALNDYHNPCDKFTEFTGGAAMVLMRKGDEFVAISSSLMDPAGERSLALKIAADHPAHPLLAAGEPHVGRASFFGRPYITRVQPAKDLQGQVVGALWVAFDLSEFDRSLRELVDQGRFFETGGMYVLEGGAGAAPGPGVALAPSRFVVDAEDSARSAASVFAAYSAVGDGAEFRNFEPLLAPDASDRFAVARLSEKTGWLVVGEASVSEASRSQWQALVPFLAMLGVGAVALCLGQYWLIGKWVARPLARVTGALQRVSSGDLSVPVERNSADEIGDMMGGVESMRLRFVELLGSLRGSVSEISTASSEIATGSQDLSQRTETTASQLQEATATMDQMCRTVEETSAVVRSADQRSVLASQAAERGGEAVAQVVSCMTTIGTSSRRITEITGVIDGIAFQTNLLALNAAVEAARAGESGRGFSVVAAEVRTLAHRAGAAAKEIKQLLQDSAKEVEAGQSLANTASARMQDIEASVKGLSEALQTIRESNAAQTDKLGQIGESVSMLDTMTQQNAALVEQSAAAAASLKDQAASLVQQMTVFKLAPEAVAEAESRPCGVST